MGFTDVSAFLTSENAIFYAPGNGSVRQENRIEAGLKSLLGYDVPTFLRRPEEGRAVSEHSPFESVVDGNLGKIQVAMSVDEIGTGKADAVALFE